VNILYHRISGAIGLTDHEAGTRGAWVEKRRNVLDWLVKRGHDVTILSHLTKATRQLPSWNYKFSVSAGADCHSADLLVLEFGPSNGSWYKEDYAFTQSVCQEYTGPIVYLCDDPDLLKPSVCRYVPQDDWSRWTFLLNCQRPELAPKVLNAPAEATYAEFNPSVGMPLDAYAPAELELLCYPGRPGGRKAQCQAMVDSECVQVVGNQAEWKGYLTTVMPSPQQANRRAFYRQFAGLICAFDKTHAELGWRTGRAYHALCAGVPVFAFPGNPALWWTQLVDNAKDITTFWAMLTDDGDDYRHHMVLNQRHYVSQDETDFLSHSTAQALGL
jgi:hypothetical protein